MKNVSLAVISKIGSQVLLGLVVLVLTGSGVSFAGTVKVKYYHMWPNDYPNSTVTQVSHLGESRVEVDCMFWKTVNNRILKEPPNF